jgi:hypothetical protein
MTWLTWVGNTAIPLSIFEEIGKRVALGGLTLREISDVFWAGGD